MRQMNKDMLSSGWITSSLLEQEPTKDFMKYFTAVHCTHTHSYITDAHEEQSHSDLFTVTVIHLYLSAGKFK